VLIVQNPTQTVTADTASDWFTVHEAAAQIKGGKRSLYRAIVRGDLRAARINERGDLRIARAWLFDWLERRAARG
jgi:excisionase family DNA binding protein